VLNCQPRGVPIFVAARLLKLLANPPPNNVKFLATAVIFDRNPQVIYH
jgi:hypothetical protein